MVNLGAEIEMSQNDDFVVLNFTVFSFWNLKEITKRL